MLSKWVTVMNKLISYLDKKVHIELGNYYTGDAVVVGVDFQDPSLICTIPENVVYDGVLLYGTLIDHTIEHFWSINCSKYFDNCYDYFDIEDVKLLTKDYPNSKLFRELYPDGYEYKGFWRVE